MGDYMKKLKFIILILFIILISVEVYAEDNILQSIEIDRDTITNGDFVDYDLDNVKINLSEDFKILNYNNIHIKENGSKDITDNFHITKKDNSILLTLKSMPPYDDYENIVLNPSKLYTIDISKGALEVNDNRYYEDIDVSFVTKDTSGDSGIYLGSSINSGTVTEDISAIEFNFIDDIQVRSGIDKAEIFDINTTALDENISNYTGEITDNFYIDVYGKTLRLRSKSGDFKNFINYNITINEDTLMLEDSNIDILNEEINLNFDNNSILKDFYPKNYSDVSLNPQLEIEFKYDIDVNLNTLKNNINIMTSGDIVPEDAIDLHIKEDKKLIINIDDTESYRLMENRRYKVIINEGLINLKNYDDVTSPTIVYYFDTLSGTSPNPIKYSSTSSARDDITQYDDTELDSNEYIYIHFDKEINWDRKKNYTNINEIIKLHKDPQTPYLDVYNNEVYDEKYIYTNIEGNIEFQKDNNPNVLALHSADIVGSNEDILRIKTKDNLKPLTRYKMTVDNSFLEGKNGEDLSKDIEFKFWTKEGNNRTTPHWSYSLSNKEYDSDNPLTLYVDSEVKVNDRDKVIRNFSEDITTISFDELLNITLKDKYFDDNISFSKYTLEYYYQDNTKKTKINLYPSESLDTGKKYMLEIPKGVFKTLAGNSTSELEVEFLTKVDSNLPSDISKIYPKEIDILDIYLKDGEFEILGYNFNSIESIDLISVGNGDIIRFENNEFNIKDSTEIKLYIKDSKIEDIISTNSIGKYMIQINYEDGTNYLEDGVFVDISSKEQIKGKDFYPEENEEYDETRIYSKKLYGKRRYFLKVSFYDPYGEMKLTSNALDNLKSSNVFSENGIQDSIVDKELLSHIQGLEDEEDKKEALKDILRTDFDDKVSYLYIPIKPLESDMRYRVKLNANIVHYSSISESILSNNSIAWSFSTMSLPEVYSINIGSVSEDYDEDEPIKIRGNDFTSGVRVYFNDERADRVYIRRDDKGEYLKVYLPDGDDRLDVGLYTVTVHNTSTHETEVFGSFSVLEELEYIPEEGYRLKKKLRDEIVLEKINVSNDTIILDDSYENDFSINIDLDKLTGINTLTKRMIFEFDDEYVSAINTYSKWSNVRLYGVYVDDYAEIILGRAEPEKVRALKNTLRGVQTKSDFIKVSGKNYSITSLELEIPIKNTDGSNIKVIRYDEEELTWKEVDFDIDKDKTKVRVKDDKTGIFVVIKEV